MANLIEAKLNRLLKNTEAKAYERVALKHNGLPRYLFIEAMLKDLENLRMPSTRKDVGKWVDANKNELGLTFGK